MSIKASCCRAPSQQPERARSGLGFLAPQLATRGPVLALDVVKQNVHAIGLPTQDLASHLGDGFGQFALLFHGTAFEQINADGGHLRLLGV